MTSEKIGLVDENRPPEGATQVRRIDAARQLVLIANTIPTQKIGITIEERTDRIIAEITDRNRGRNDVRTSIRLADEVVMATVILDIRNRGSLLPGSRLAEVDPGVRRGEKAKKEKDHIHQTTRNDEAININIQTILPNSPWDL
jgi:hypothetical protein